MKLAKACGAAVILIGMAANAGASSSRPVSAEIWAAGDGEKIRRTDLDSPLREENSIWDGKKIRLQSARNEVISFQVMVSARSKALKVTSLRLDFGRPDLNVGVEIFSQHYLNIPEVSPGNDRKGRWGWFWYDAAAPNVSGWVPDALIPLNARAGRGGLPLKIAAGNLQGFWVDVSVPRDFGGKAGIYKGVFSVEIGGDKRDLPIELEILNMTLPDDDLVKTMIPMGGIERRHGRKDPALVHAYRVMAHRHRFDPAEHVRFGQMEEYRPYLDGTAFSAQKGYTGPGRDVGFKIFAIDLYGTGVSFAATREETWRNFVRWALWFQDHAPEVLAFYYIYDEPPRKLFPQIAERAGWIKSNPGPGGAIPILLTKRPYEELEGSIDIWATPADHVKLAEVAARKKKGQRWWFYNGMRPMSGAVTIDAQAVDFRVQPWICWLYGIELWFYWESTHWQHNQQGPRAKKDQNVFEDPATFVNDHGMKVNGDGTLFYPGEDKFFRKQSRGIKGPISSIRMKNLRRGQQDVAYIQLAIEAGKEKQARAIARTLIPRAFDLAKPDEPVAWPQDGKSWDEARRKIAQLALEAGARD